MFHAVSVVLTDGALGVTYCAVIHVLHVFPGELLAVCRIENWRCYGFWGKRLKTKKPCMLNLASTSAAGDVIIDAIGSTSSFKNLVPCSNYE